MVGSETAGAKSIKAKQLSELGYRNAVIGSRAPGLQAVIDLI